MLENSVWRQYHQSVNLYAVLSDFYAPWEMEIERDELFLHNTLKAKLTKKEFRLFAMMSAKIADETMCERFGFSHEELQKAKEKVVKKLKQDKVRLAFRKRSELDEQID